MEIYESIAWNATGFIPTLVAMEIAHRAASKFSSGHSLAGRKKIAVLSKTMDEVPTS